MGVNHQIGGGGVAPMEASSASRHPSDANHHSNALDQLIKSCASLQCNAEVHEKRGCKAQGLHVWQPSGVVRIVSSFSQGHIVYSFLKVRTIHLKACPRAEKTKNTVNTVRFAPMALHGDL